MADANLTERQRKWFDSVRQGLERETGRTISEWVAIARSCPETGHRARLRWFKETHGLLQNRASYVISEAFESQTPWSEPHALVDSLWADPGARAIYQAVDTAALSLDGAIRTARKGYTAWARKVQFAAAKPVKGGVCLGLATPLASDARLEPRGSQSWSERLGADLPCGFRPTSMLRWLHCCAWRGRAHEAVYGPFTRFRRNPAPVRRIIWIWPLNRGGSASMPSRGPLPDAWRATYCPGRPSAACYVRAGEANPIWSLRCRNQTTHRVARPCAGMPKPKTSDRCRPVGRRFGPATA